MIFSLPVTKNEGSPHPQCGPHWPENGAIKLPAQGAKLLHLILRAEISLLEYRRSYMREAPRTMNLKCQH